MFFSSGMSSYQFFFYHFSKKTEKIRFNFKFVLDFKLVKTQKGATSFDKHKQYNINFFITIFSKITYKSYRR